MQGIYIHGRRPKSKKEVKELVKQYGDAPTAPIQIEATSAFGNEFDGMLSDAPDGRYAIVGPDPYTKRDFYLTLEKRAGKVKVT